MLLGHIDYNSKMFWLHFVQNSFLSFLRLVTVVLLLMEWINLPVYSQMIEGCRKNGLKNYLCSLTWVDHVIKIYRQTYTFSIHLQS